MQNAITDAKNYLETLLKITDHQDAAERQRLISAYDAEMIERGATAVTQSLREAEFSLNVETINKMLMATHGHGNLVNEKGSAEVKVGAAN